MKTYTVTLSIYQGVQYQEVKARSRAEAIEKVAGEFGVYPSERVKKMIERGTVGYFDDNTCWELCSVEEE